MSAPLEIAKNIEFYEFNSEETTEDMFRLAKEVVRLTEVINDKWTMFDEFKLALAKQSEALREANKIIKIFANPNFGEQDEAAIEWLDAYGSMIKPTSEDRGKIANIIDGVEK